MDRSWWRDGALYQVYPRSFADGDGDGHGDLPGLTAKLDYLAWLGVEGVWLNPINSSPNVDWGYDVADYCAVHPDFGTLEDLDALVAGAHGRDIRILLDLVPNHTSIEHPWFSESRSSRENPRRDWYVWADAKPDGSPPNNWVSMFGGPAWTFDEQTGQCYLHNFTPGQPDLNWWCEDVRVEFDDILRFWLDRGADGFRLDVCQAIVKDRELRDNPPADETDRKNVRLRGQKPYYCMNRPEVHDVLRRWRRLCEGYDHKPILLGETNTHDLGALARYYGDHAEDEVHMAFNFPFMGRQFAAGPLREIIARTEASLPAHAQQVWTMSNHDAPRFVTRWCGDDQNKVRVALLLLGALRGTPMLYYGDELGMPDAPPIPVERSRDWLARDPLPGKGSRDPCRSPMPWDQGAGAGFCPPGVEPWLPLGETERCNVALQKAVSDSHLHFTRALLALRRERPELYRAPMEPAGDEQLLTLGRGARDIVYLNLSDHPRSVEVAGQVLLATDRAQEGQAEGGLTLAPWQGAVVERA